MKINDNGEICLDFFEIMESASAKDKIELIERLSCEDAVIEHVTKQIFDGCTDNGYYGSEMLDELHMSSSLQQARERVREESNVLCRKELKRLREKVKNLNRYYDAGWNEYHKLNNKIHNNNY